MSSRVHLINPSNLSFGVAVITPRWLYVLAAATGTRASKRLVVMPAVPRYRPADDAPGEGGAGVLFQQSGTR